MYQLSPYLVSFPVPHSYSSLAVTVCNASNIKQRLETILGGGWKCGWEGERGNVATVFPRSNAEASSRDLLWRLIEGGVY